MGWLLSLLDVAETPDVSASFAAPSLPAGVYGGYLVAGLGAGGYVYVFRSETLFSVGNGWRLGSFLSDWYFRIHFFPSVLNFGSFSQAINGSVFVWNAYLGPVTLNTVTAGAGDQGVTYNAPALPAAFSALQMRSASFNATFEGPFSIIESFDFAFSNGDVATLGVVGVRITPPEAVAFAFLPDWKSKVVISQEWKTQITLSRNGREQRSALRAAPRKTINFVTHIKPADQAQFKRAIARGSQATFIVPELPRRVTLVSAETDGVTIVTDATPYWAQPESWLVMRLGPRVSARKVRSVSTSGIEFYSDDGYIWAPGALIHPGLICERPDELQAQLLTNTKAVIQLQLDVVPGSEPIEDYGVDDTVFDGREVLLLRSNWADGKPRVLQRLSEVVDPGFGVRSRFYPIPHLTDLTTHAFVGKNLAEAEKIKSFFHRRRGRQGEFYIPTWEHDLTPDAPLASGEAEFRTAGQDDALAYGLDLVRRAVMVKLNSGAVYYRVVSSIEPGEDSGGLFSLFTVIGTWPSTIQPEEIERVSWLNLARFASDLIQMEWPTDQVAQTQLAVQTLERLPAET